MESDSLRSAAFDIFRAGLAAVEPAAAVRRALVPAADRGFVLVGVDGARHPLSLPRGRVVTVGMGKAAAVMARALEEVLAARLEGGVVVTKEGHSVPTDRVVVREAAHPVPDERGAAAAEEIGTLVDGLGPDDLLFVLVSGGGSALLPAPVPGITLACKQRLTDDLLRAGATIDDLNAVRRRLSRLKGGGLLRRASPATVVGLVLSDVIGDSLSVIASGPTVPPSPHGPQAREVLERYGLWEGLPPTVQACCEAPVQPGPADAAPRFHNVLVATNRACLEACRVRAEALGFRPARVVTCDLAGEAREVGARLGRELAARRRETDGAACWLYGGETTVTVTGTGLGGRNQELALAAARELDGIAGVVLLSGGTDGTDGPTDAAGAIVDGSSAGLLRGAGLSIDALLGGNDSYEGLRRIGHLLVTGPTRTNVMDVQVLLVG